MKTNSDFFDDVLAWWKQPFQTSGSVFNWALFIGLVIVLAWGWWTVLRHVTNEV